MSISVFAVLIVAAAILTFYYLNIGPTGFAIFQQDTQSSFDEGAYSSTVYDSNKSSVILAANQTSGTYTSKILDANSSSSTWNNLTWTGRGVVFEVRNCAAADCSDANFTAVADLNNLNLTKRYFQYKASFDSFNDTLGSVTIDSAATQQPSPLSVSVSEPNTEYDSLSGIPLTFTLTGGTGTNLTCSYDITYGAGVLVSNTSINCVNGTNTQTFDLGDEGGANVLTVYVSDGSENTSTSSSFSVDVPSSSSEESAPEEEVVEPPPEEIISETPPAVTHITLSEISEQEVIQGNSKELGISVQNTGTVPLSFCKLSGDDSGWFSITSAAININSGEQPTLPFSVNIPEETSPGAYTLGLSVDCTEVTTSKQFTVNVIQKKLDFNITNVQRTREDRVRVDYSLTELAGEDQDVQILFRITDASGLEIANTSQNSSIDANKTDDFRVNIPINETLGGNLTLSAAFNSQIYSSSVLEPITLGAPIGGFAIFEGVGGAGGVIIFVVVVLVLVTVFFLARQMRKSGKSLNDLLEH